ncbi:MAG: DUF692 domain-containing protein, partial [Armatimonadota bacterium]|nr:DUF692 domain-containing protein [Armatimonadota bacterium]
EVDFLEITADHYFDVGPEKEQELELLAAHFTLIPHGLSLSLGSAEGLDDAYVRRLARLVRTVNQPYWSEHIAFTRAGGVDIGHLCPLPFAEEAIDVLCRNIAEVQRVIDVPLILENITYTVTMPGAQMSEAEFLCELLERTDCGLLLDVTNLYVNATNHSYDALAFVDQLPLERIVQFHFVGVERRHGILIDSHAQPTPAEVWNLMDAITARSPVKGMILERDENLPPFEEIVAELQQARAIMRRHGRW